MWWTGFSIYVPLLVFFGGVCVRSSQEPEGHFSPEGPKMRPVVEKENMTLRSRASFAWTAPTWRRTTPPRCRAARAKAIAPQTTPLTAKRTRSPPSEDDEFWRFRNFQVVKKQSESMIPSWRFLTTGLKRKNNPYFGVSKLCVDSTPPSD